MNQENNKNHKHKASANSIKDHKLTDTENNVPTLKSITIDETTIKALNQQNFEPKDQTAYSYQWSNIKHALQDEIDVQLVG